jgi:hypothetical protein
MGLTGEKPDSEPGGQIRFVCKDRVNFFGHVLCQDGGNSSWMVGKALDAVLAMVSIDEFTKTIDRVLRSLIVRCSRSYESSANGGDDDEISEKPPPESNQAFSVA